MLKTCKSCLNEHPASGFYRHSRGGLFAQCKQCVSVARRLRYVNDRDALKTRVLARARTPFGMFYTQRASAQRRGIEWLLTFEQWSDIWQQSGKWAERGITRGRYVMARHGDSGPYAIANVKIITGQENIAERWMHSSSIKNLPQNSDTNEYESPNLIRRNS